MKRISVILMTAFLANTSSMAVAHPGHGTGGGNHSLVHYLTEPVHVAAILSVVVGSALAILYFRVRLVGHGACVEPCPKRPAECH